MTPFQFFLVVFTEFCAVTGNLFLKHAMVHEDAAKTRKFLAVGIAVLALNFFLWLGLLPKFTLSYLYPFDGLNRLMLVTGAIVFLKEKVTPPLWLGMVLITAGIYLVAATEAPDQPAKSAANAPAVVEAKAGGKL